MDGYGPSTYGDRIAEVYDDWYTARMDPTAAVDFLAPLSRGGRVLELGIGTGRVAPPLAARGINVSGIDASSRMVEKLRAKPGGSGIPVVIGDFADVPVDGAFSLVFIAFTTFFALTSQEDQLRCIRRVPEVLDPGGRFVLEMFVPDVTRFSASQSTNTLETGADYVLLDVMARLSELEFEEGFAWYDRSPFDSRSTRHVSVYRRSDSR